MATYVQLMPALVQRRMADYEATSAVPRAAAEQLETSPSGSSPSANLGKGGAGWTLKLKEPVDLGLGAACV